ncbi:MAG: hypothetical protein HY735_02755 [Verrucomicrobia bacterium]|nr:hypothetical protein [Verrucomicrobiota bacterium]
MEQLLEDIRRPDANHQRIAERVVRTSASLPQLLQGLTAEKARVKFGCAKVVRVVSQRHPELLYPHFDFFVGLLAHENKILQWEAMFVLSRLAQVDGSDKFASIFDQYFSPIPGPMMITAANVIRGAAWIARAKPQWADRIAREVLKVRRAKYQTAECRNVAIGHAIVSLGEFFDLIQDRGPVLRFVRQQRRNPRNAVRRKAAVFLKKLRPSIEKCRSG